MTRLGRAFGFVSRHCLSAGGCGGVLDATAVPARVKGRGFADSAPATRPAPSRTRLVGLAITLVTAISGLARSAELIPTPEFAEHSIPTSAVPLPTGQVPPLLDVLILLAALSVATYLVLIARHRRWLLALSVASLAWFGFWRQGCVCPIGATQNVALALVDPSYVIPLSVVAFFLLPLLFSLFFGRSFCAAVCPLGAVQELVAVRPVQVPRWIDQSLGLVPYFYLGAAVVFAATGSGFLICRYDPFVAFFRLNGSASMLLFGGALLVVGVFVGRPYCRYLCPYGALLRLVSRFSQWRVRITPSACLQCRLCEYVCPYGAIRTPTAEETPDRRRLGRRQLAAILLSVPCLLVVFALAGHGLALPLSHWHPEVQLAEQVRAEEIDPTTIKTDASEAFTTSGRPRQELYQSALAMRRRFQWLGICLGGWVGLVLGGKLTQLSLRRRRTDFEPDPSACLACGRCYWYCPVEQVRLGLISDVSVMIPDLELTKK